MGQSALPVNEFNQHYAEVSCELELEKRHKDMILKKSSSEFWFDEPIDGMDVAELEHYIFSLQELKRKVLTRANELMMINNAPDVFGQSINNTTPLAILGPTVLQHLQGPETNVLQGPNVLSREGLNVFHNAWKNNKGQYYFDHALMMNANYSLFGSTLTFDAMIGEIASGSIADFVSCKGIMIAVAVSLPFVIGTMITWRVLALIAGIEGLADCKASASNLRRIQVKVIVKEVENYLKTYSSAGMDIS
ncbi:hypothetical protein Tco_0052533 [Tanacetum coccineum]